MATIQKKSFWQQYGGLILILGGIAIGALIGAFAPSVGTTIKPIGDIFLNLLFTIVVPLVFVSIASMIVTRLVEGKDWLVKAVAAKKETA